MFGLTEHQQLLLMLAPCTLVCTCLCIWGGYKVVKFLIDEFPLVLVAALGDPSKRNPNDHGEV